MPTALAIAHHGDYDPGLVGIAAQHFGYDLHMIAREDFVSADQMPNPQDFDLIIPFGSAWSNPGGDHPEHVAAEVELLRRAHNNVPIFAVCFGAQQLSSALGGSVRHADIPEIGWYSVESTDAGIAAGPWMQFHFDEIVPPATAQVIARTTSVQAFRVDTSLGVQFHPEVTRRTVQRWIDDGGEKYLAKLGLTTAGVLQQCNDHAAAAPQRAVDLLGAFLASINAAHGEKS